MFVNPGIPLKDGTQHSFTKMIMSLQGTPTRKSSEINVERIKCSISDQFKFQPTTDAIWRSTRSRHIPRVSRNFLWKLYRVGSFWEQIPDLEILGTCSACGALESMEHILLECVEPGQREVWNLAECIWQLRYNDWLKLNWGVLLGCGLARFKSPKGNHIPAKNRFFAIVVSITWESVH
ncbi:hypothetical protein B0H12DRAFT_1015589 [Mycena haematopus]|nr:hypothetical protein B0H12DRAFT_1015589 [Mycena haematopus]